jgi:hypothetical protein
MVEESASLASFLFVSTRLAVTMYLHFVTHSNPTHAAKRTVDPHRTIAKQTVTRPLLTERGEIRERPFAVFEPDPCM